MTELEKSLSRLSLINNTHTSNTTILEHRSTEEASPSRIVNENTLAPRVNVQSGLQLIESPKKVITNRISVSALEEIESGQLKR